MRLSDFTRMTSAAPEAKVGDLRKDFPKRSFKGWKAVYSKPDHVWYEKGKDHIFRVELSLGSPVLHVRWPKSMGAQFVPPGMGWMAKPFLESYEFTYRGRPEEWPKDKKALQKVVQTILKKSK